MTKTIRGNAAKLSRRTFVVGTAAAAGGGLALGFHMPFGIETAAAQGAEGAEINAWVVIKPDDTTVIRIARSEMGQGTLTGLAQLVAEELECDWSTVTTEFPTPGQSVARKRAWGDFSTGGSRGIRASQDYVRKGGATARVMLIQAAANEWKVPASECTAANSVITHTPSGRTTTYGALAHELGGPRLVRAVGSANARNPISIIVPCHRVLGSDGSLTGYAGGLERKRYLLDLESPERVG